MEKYIEQLIGDMREAAKNLPPVPDFDLPEEMECLQGVMEWEEAEYKPFEEWFGIEKKVFPPSDKLSDVQIKVMVSELINLWNAYNFHPTLPDNLPDRLTYDIMVNFMDEPVQWISEGMCHIEFCEYDPPHCPFPPEYCMCHDFEEQQKKFDDVGNYRELFKINQELRFLDRTHRQKGVFLFIVDWKIEKIVKKVNKSIEILQSDSESSDLMKVHLANQISQYNFARGIEDLTGISAKEFPNYKYLNGYQMRRVLQVLLELLNVIKVKVKFYKGLPLELKYQYLVNSWKDEPLSFYFDTESEWDELPIIPGVCKK